MIEYAITFGITASNDKSFTLFSSTGSDYYNIFSLSLKYSILTSSNLSIIALDYKSQPNLIPDKYKIKTGQGITVSIVNNNFSNVIFSGYIRVKQFVRNVNGTFLYLVIDNTLGQLRDMSVNTSWNQATQAYDTIMTNIQGSTLSLDTLLKAVGKGTLLTAVPDNADAIALSSGLTWWNYVNGQAPALPTKIWAVAQTNKVRDDLIRELLFPYNRLIFQKPDGTINIQPLFYDDTASPFWDIDITDNNLTSWLDIKLLDESANVINRIDCQFAAILPFDQYGATSSTDNNYYISSFANPKYYKRINDLLESGIFSSSRLMQKALSTDIITDSSLLNSFISAYGYNNLQTLSKFNKIYKKPSQIDNVTIPQIYASNQMASNLINAYNAEISIDYSKMIDLDGNPLEFPLGKIITIESYGELDYNSMLCSMCSFNLDNSTGSTLKLTLFPLESVTGKWFNLK